MLYIVIAALVVAPKLNPTQIDINETIGRRRRAVHPKQGEERLG